MKGGAERLAGFGVGEQAFEGESDRDDLGDAAEGEGAVHDPEPVGRTAKALTVIGHGGEFDHIEKVRAAEVIVAFGVLRAQGERFDGDIEGAGGGIFGDGDGAGGFIESASNDAHDVVPGAEGDKGVNGVDGIGAGRRKFGGS